MRYLPFRFVPLVTAIALFLAAPAAAQQDTTPEAPVADSTRALLQELQQIQQKLTDIREQAFQQSPQLRQQRDTVRKVVERAMREEDPKLDERLGRLDSVRMEMRDARQAQDAEKMQQLMTQARGVQQNIQAARRKAMQREDVANEIASFENNLIAEMTKVDPGAEALLARAREIVARLRS